MSRCHHGAIIGRHHGRTAQRRNACFTRSTSRSNGSGAIVTPTARQGVAAPDIRGTWHRSGARPSACSLGEATDRCRRPRFACWKPRGDCGANRLLDTPIGRGYCADSLSSEAGETVILPDDRNARPDGGCTAPKVHADPAKLSGKRTASDRTLWRVGRDRGSPKVIISGTTDRGGDEGRHGLSSDQPPTSHPWRIPCLPHPILQT